MFFCNDTVTTEIYTLSLHDALPIFAHQNTLPVGEGAAPSRPPEASSPPHPRPDAHDPPHGALYPRDRKSTRLNSSHANISYAVFCLKQKPTRSSKSRPTPTTSSPLC